MAWKSDRKTLVCSLKCGHMVRHGAFYRKSDAKRIERFKCYKCRQTKSLATGTPCFGQNKRRINDPLLKLLCSGVSQRRCALILGVTRKTVEKKFRFLGEQARLSNKFFLNQYERNQIQRAQFDEMETHEHTKLKPLSIALFVSEEKRKILGFAVSEMPAKGLLAQKSIKKYGKRRDDRKKGMLSVLKRIQPLLTKEAIVTSDEKPHYPVWLKEHQLKWTHQTVKGKRGCITGQGELKKIGFDPLFSLNHTAAMLRANVSRLFRRTWNTTKKKERLRDHLEIYMDFHNRILTA